MKAGMTARRNYKMNKPKKFITGMLAMALALGMAGCEQGAGSSVAYAWR
jgi:hypothetical protein